jgi:hypothetical protein
LVSAIGKQQHHGPDVRKAWPLILDQPQTVLERPIGAGYVRRRQVTKHQPRDRPGKRAEDHPPGDETDVAPGLVEDAVAHGHRAEDEQGEVHVRQESPPRDLLVEVDQDHPEQRQPAEDVERVQALLGVQGRW